MTRAKELHRTVRLAREHALLCNAVEEICPPVCAPYLQAAYERMKLCEEYGIRLDYDDGNAMWWVVSDVRPDDFGDCYSEREAADSYFALCDQLSQPAPASSLSNSGAQTAGASAPAHSIEPAASSADSPADTAASGTAVAAEPPIPGSAAPISGVA